MCPKTSELGPSDVMLMLLNVLRLILLHIITCISDLRGNHNTRVELSSRAV